MSEFQETPRDSVGGSGGKYNCGGNPMTEGGGGGINLKPPDPVIHCIEMPTCGGVSGQDSSVVNSSTP